MADTSNDGTGDPLGGGQSKAKKRKTKRIKVLGSKLNNPSKTNKLFKRRLNTLLARIYRFAEEHNVSAVLCVGQEGSSSVTVAGVGHLLEKIPQDQPHHIDWTPPNLGGDITPSMQICSNIELGESIPKEEIQVKSEKKAKKNEASVEGGWDSECLDCFLEEKLDWRKIEQYRESLNKLRLHARSIEEFDVIDKPKVKVIIKKLVPESSRALYSLFLETLLEILQKHQNICEVEDILPSLLDIVGAGTVHKTLKQKIINVLESVKAKLDHQLQFDALQKLILNDPVDHMKISLLEYMRAILKSKKPLVFKSNSKHSLEIIINMMSSEDDKLQKNARDTIWALANAGQNLKNYLLDLDEPFKEKVLISLGLPTTVEVPALDVEESLPSTSGDSSGIYGLEPKKSKLSKKRKLVDYKKSMPPPSTIRPKWTPPPSTIKQKRAEMNKNTLS